jgi:hypothetical protein
MASMKPSHVAVFDQAGAEVDDLIEAWRQESVKADKVGVIGGLSMVLRERHGDNYARYAVLLFAAVEKLAAVPDGAH